MVNAPGMKYPKKSNVENGFLFASVKFAAIIVLFITSQCYNITIFTLLIIITKKKIIYLFSLLGDGRNTFLLMPNFSNLAASLKSTICKLQ